MDWKITDYNTFYVMVTQRCFNEVNAKSGIPKFRSEYREVFGDKVAPTLGINRVIEDSLDWVYGIGDKCKKNAPCPKDYEIVRINGGQRAEFLCSDDAQVWKYIYGEWFVTSGYEILPDDTLEFYDESGNLYMVSIPVKKR